MSFRLDFARVPSEMPRECAQARGFLGQGGPARLSTDRVPFDPGWGVSAISALPAVLGLGPGSLYGGSSRESRREGQLHLVGRGAVARPVPAEPVQGRHAPDDRPATARLRAGTDQGQSPRQAQEPRGRQAQAAGPDPVPGFRRAVLQHEPVHLRQAEGRPEQRRRQPDPLHEGLLGPRAGDPRPLRLRGAHRQARQGRPALPRGAEVLRDRPAPGPGLQPRDGHHLRGAGPAVQRGVERGGGRSLHPARGDPADGQSSVPAGRRHPDHEGGGPHAVRPGVRDGRHAVRRRGLPSRAQS